MNIADVYDPRLKPGRRLLMQRIAVTSGGLFNRRAERLQIRALERGWQAAVSEQLLSRLLQHAEQAQDQLLAEAFDRRQWARSRNSLARANGWGSASKCPVAHDTKTLAAQIGVPLLTPATAHAAAGGGVV